MQNYGVTIISIGIFVIKKKLKFEAKRHATKLPLCQYNK